jgi:addiction module RelE/StbE family toxin
MNVRRASIDQRGCGGISQALGAMDHWDCHVKPDLVLIYRKPDAETLQLVRLGSHSELGL